MKKTLVVTNYFPPHVAGPATILGNLFGQLDSREFCLLGYKDSQMLDTRIDPASVIECPTYLCSFPNLLRRMAPRIFQEHRNQYLLIPAIVAQGLRAILRQKIDYILGVVNADGGAWLVAAYLLHRLTGKPFFLYGIDLWQETMAVSRVERMMSHLFERRIFQSATRVWVISGALRDIYAEKYGLKPDLLPISIKLPENRRDPLAKVGLGGEHLIAFTGSVYSACLDSLLNLTNVINSVPKGNMKLFLATGRSKEELDGMGIQGPGIESAFLSKDESLRLQRDASILFLPQAFNTSYQSVVNTLFPTKTAEYLISGTPILVHAPADSQIAQYAKEHGFALVVDRFDVEELGKAVNRLLQDEPLRERLVERAWQTALKNHDSKKVAQQFRGVLS